MRSAPLDRDLRALVALALLAVLRFLPDWLKGLAFYWGDLAYLHHPWRTFDAQLLQAGRLPLWNPYLYFGMPQAAAMQDSLWYPGTVFFFLLPFPWALAFFQAAQYGLCGALALLWLRSLGLKRGSALLGGALWALGGVMLSRLPFLNHLAALSLFPALLLFARRPLLLALTLSLTLLAGYPPFAAGTALAAWALCALLAKRPWRRARESAPAWLWAGLLSAAFSAVLLVPAAELFLCSRRAGGMSPEETLRFGFMPSDILRWASPWVAGRFDPAVEWWLCCFVGISGSTAIFFGLRALRRRAAISLSCWLMAVVILILGGSNPLSSWLWETLPPLKFVRYPGNMSYLALPVLSLLAASGLERAGRGRWALLIVAEIWLYGVGAFPSAPAGLFSSKGPLVERLQKEDAQTRYLLSPKALGTHAGAGVYDWKHRLYGLTNAPFRLRAAANFGEPLVPAANYAVMDALLRAPSAAAAAAFFPWAEIGFLMTPAPVASPLPGMRREGGALWELYRAVPAPPPASWHSSAAGESLPALWPGAPPPRGRPLRALRAREDRFTVLGEAARPGWVYVPQPRYPGWTARLETPAGTSRVGVEAALLAFQKVAVPAGPWRVHFRYEPRTTIVGACLSLLALLGFAVYWYNRATLWAGAI